MVGLKIELVSFFSPVPVCLPGGGKNDKDVRKWREKEKVLTTDAFCIQTVSFLTRCVS